MKKLFTRAFIFVILYMTQDEKKMKHVLRLEFEAFTNMENLIEQHCNNKDCNCVFFQRGFIDSMNKIFKVVWSKTKECYVVVSEIAKNNGGKKKVLASVLAGLAMVGAGAMGTPVQAGQDLNKKVNISPSGTNIGSYPTANTASENSIVVGYGNTTAGAAGNGHVVYGFGNTATEDTTTALGGGNKATGPAATAVGSFNEATARASVAMGNVAKATGVKSISIGNYSVANSDNDIAIGNQAKTTSTGDSIAMGRQATAGNANALAFGAEANAAGWGSISAGRLSKAESNYSVALGDSSNAQGSNAAAFGASSFANGAVATAIGGGAKVGDATNAYEGGVAVGRKAQAMGTHAIALGNESKATATGAIASGDGANASAENASAYGAGAQATNKQTTAVGNASVASGENASAFGYNNKVTGDNSTAVGTGNTIDGTQVAGAVAVGKNNKSSADRAISIGEENTSKAADTITMGDSNKSNTGGGIAIGKNNLADSTDEGTKTDGGRGDQNSQIAIGRDNKATHIDTVAVGREVKSTGTGAVGLGSRINATGDYAVAIGNSSKGGTVEAADYAVAVGFKAKATGSRSIAQGGAAEAAANASIAMGLRSKVNAQKATSNYEFSGSHGTPSPAGYNTETITINSASAPTSGAVAGNYYDAGSAIAVGEGATVSDESDRAVVVGPDAKTVGNAHYSVVLGSGSHADASDGFVAGHGSYVESRESISMGSGAHVSGNENIRSQAIGYGATVTGTGAYDATAIGATAQVSGVQGGVALGSGSLLSRTTNSNENVGFNSKFVDGTKVRNRAYTAKVNALGDEWDAGAQLGGVSVGNDDQKRQIINVAAGNKDTDAVNVAQLKNVGVRVGADTNTATITVDKNTSQVAADFLAYNGQLNIKGDSNRITTVSENDTNGKDANVNVKFDYDGLVKAKAGSSVTVNQKTEGGKTVFEIDAAAAGKTVVTDGKNTTVSGTGTATDPYKVNVQGALTDISSITNTAGSGKITFGPDETVTVGGTNPINLNAKTGNIGGLTNKTFDPNNIVSGQAATEDQLKSAHDSLKASELHIAPTAVKSGSTEAKGGVAAGAENVYKYDAATKKVTLTYNDGNGKAVTDTKAVIDFSNLNIPAGGNNYGFKANATANGGTVANDTTTPAVATAVENGGTINYAAGKNLTVKQDIDTTNKTHTYTYSLDKDLTNLDKVVVNGKDGVAGKDGVTIIGPQGATGAPGIPGTNGIDGKVGISGKDGKDAVSISGKDGVGHIGLTGPAGKDGKNATADITVKEGKAGVDGKDGVDGITRIVYQDKDGNEHEVATHDDGMKFAGDDGQTNQDTNANVIKKHLNNVVDIVGGADKDKLTDKNIGVNNDNGKLKVQLAKEVDLTKDGSLTIGDTKINNAGMTITGGPSITKTGIDAGSKKITNVTAGTADTDAVNVKQLKDTEKHIKPDTYAVAKDGSVTMTYVDGNGADVPNDKAIITGIAKQDLSNINDDGKKVITGLGSKVKAGDNVTVTDTTDATTGQKTYTVNAKLAKIEDGKNTKKSGTGTDADPYKVNVEGALTDITSITNTAGSGKITFGPDETVTVGGTNPINLNAKTGNIGGLTNKTFDPNNIVSGQAATEDQLKSAHDSLKASELHIAPTAVKSGSTEAKGGVAAGAENVYKYDAATKKVTLTYNDGNGKAVTDTKAVIDFSNLNIPAGGNNYGFKANATANGGTVANDTTTPAVATAVENGGTINYAAGKNLTVKQDIDTTNKTHTYTYSLDKDLTNLDKVVVNGKDGVAGKDGVTIIGPQGATGAPGIPGTNGIDGKVGISGKDGKDAVSIAGKDGVGTIGLTGPQGPAGTNGKSVDISTENGKQTLVKPEANNGNQSQRIVYVPKDANGNPLKDADGNDIKREVATMDDGLKFAGDDGQTNANKVIAKQLNQQVDIVGGATGTLTDKNIGVNNDGGKLKVQLAKDVDLTNAGSLTVGGTKVNNDGITIKAPTPAAGTTATTTDVKLTNTGLDNGGNTITNVAEGQNNTDAVNVKQLKANRTEVKAGDNVVVTSAVDATDNHTVYTVNAVTPAVYTTPDGEKLTKDKDGKFHKAGETAEYTGDIITSFENPKAAAGQTTKDGGMIVNNVGSAIKNQTPTMPAGQTATYLDKLKAAADDNSNVKNAVVNVSDLKNTSDALIDKGLRFDANEGGEQTNKLGSKVTVQGTGALSTGKAYADEYNTANIRTNIEQGTDGNTTINVGLAKALKGINSISNGGSSITISDVPAGATTPAVTISGGNLSMGDGTANNKIVNLAPGTDGTDAVNLNQLKGMRTVVTSADKSVTVTPSENKATGQVTYDLKVATTGTVSKSTWDLKSGVASATEGTHSGDTTQTIADTKSVTMQAGKNLTVKQTNDGNGNTSVAYSLDKDLTNLDKVVVNGKDGVAGKDGVTIIGPQGATGAPGIPGTNGIDGKVGISGKDGKDAVSIAGKDGVGHIGLTGPAGKDGKNATADITVKEGKAGVDGKDGVDGITRIVYQDKDGNEHEVATHDDGMKFAGDDGQTNQDTNANVIKKHLNNVVDIVGGADKDKLTDKNIGVNNDNGKLKVQLAKDVDLTKDGSLTIGDTNITKDGLTITGGPSVKKDGINAGDKKITNVADGAVTATSKDAVNGSQLHAVKAAERHIKPDTYTVANDGSVTLNYVDGDGKDTSEKAKITGIAKQDLSNINDDGKKVITGLGSKVKAGDNVTVTDTTDATTGQKTYTVNAKLAKIEDGKNTKKSGTGTDADPYKVNVEGALTDITSITNTAGSGKITFGPDETVTVGGTNPINLNAKTGNIGGLTNKTFDPNNIVSGQAATEDQLKSAHDSLKASELHIAPTAVKSGSTEAKGGVAAGAENVYKYDAATKKVTLTYNDGNGKAVTDTKAVIDFSALNTGGTTASTWTAKTSAENTTAGSEVGKHAGDASQVIGNQNSVDFQAGRNMTVTQTNDGNGNTTINYALDKDLTNLDKVVVNGKDGIAGKDGVTIVGPQGATGAPGLPGTNGIDGKVGISGKDGKDAVSISGKDGVGHIGLTGPAGKDGKNATADITVKEGKAGVDGKDGVDGITRIVYQDKDGNEHEVATHDDGMKFAGDDGQTNQDTNANVIKKHLNNVVDIVGGADKDKLTDKNIGVNNDNGKLKVQLAKDVDLTKDGSLTIGGTNITKDGLTITDGPSVKKDGINAGDKKITNVEKGVADTDAVNVKQLKDTEKHIKPDTYAVAKDGSVTMTYVDGNGADVPNDKAIITGIAKQDLSNINDDGKKVITGLGSKVKAGDNVTVTDTTDATTGQKTYTVNAKLAKIEDGKNTKKSGTGTDADPYKVNVEGALTDITSITNTAGSGKISFEGDQVVKVGGNHPISFDGKGGYVTGLENKTWDLKNPTVVSGRAATEDQLKAVSDGFNNTVKLTGNTGATGTQKLNQDNGLSFGVVGANNGQYIKTSASGSDVVADLSDDAKAKLNKTYTVSSGSKNVTVTSTTVGNNTDFKITVASTGTTTSSSWNLNSGVASTKEGTHAGDTTQNIADTKTVTMQAGKNLTVKQTNDGNGNTSVAYSLDKDLTNLDKVVVNGKDGIDGKDGVSITGPKGESAPGAKDGQDGKVGIAGKDGKDAVSIAGKDGVGHIGLTGPAGKDGKNATADITVKEGKAGVDGKDGVDGITRIVYQDKDGNEHEVATHDDGMKFAGDDGQDNQDTNAQVIKKHLNKVVDIVGGADKTKLTDKNIGVNNVNGKLKVQLAKDINLTDTGSIKFGDTADNNTVINKGGITITKPATATNPAKTVSLTGDGLNNGGNKITNVAAGTASTDAVNVKQLNDKVTTVTSDGSITVTDNNTDSTKGHAYNIKVNNQGVVNNAQTPVVYTKEDGTKVYLVKGKFYEDPKGTGAEVPKAQVIASMNNADNSSTTPMKLNNVGSSIQKPNSTDTFLKQLDDANKNTPNGAVNVSDLKKTSDALIDKGLVFDANNKDPKTNKLGSKVTIAGKGALANGENFADKYDTKNIRTNITQDGDGNTTVEIGLTKNLKGLESVSVPGKDGVDGKDGVSITGKDGANGLDGKVGIAGKDGKDAVSISGKDGVGHIGLTGPAGKDGKDATADITVKEGKAGVDGKDGVDGITRIVYNDKDGNEHQVATHDDGMKFAGDDGQTNQDTNPQVIKKHLNKVVDIVGGADKTKLTDNNIGVNNDGGKLKVQLSSELSGITKISNGGSSITLNSTPSATVPAVTISGGNLDMGGNKITHVKAGTNDTDAVNLKQLKDSRTTVSSKDGSVTITPTENGDSTNYDLKVNPPLDPRVDQLAEEVGRVGAQGAALAALKPIQYDPLEPTQIMAGYGNYRGNSAVALGVAHYKNESTLIHGGVSWAGGSSHMMANAGVTWKVGNRDSEAAVADRYRKGPISSTYAMQQEMAAMKAQNAGLKGEVSDLKAENEQMKAQIAAMMAKLGL